MTAPLIRLADRLRVNAPIATFDPIALSEENAAAMQRICFKVTEALARGVPIIVGDNISEYYYNGTDKEDWFVDRDFPCLVPPFSEFWVEWTQPSQIRSEIHGISSPESSAFPLTGFLCTVKSPQDARRDWGTDRFTQDTSGRMLGLFTDGATWVWHFQPMGFVTGKFAGVMGSDEMFAIPAGEFWLTTDERGNVVHYVVTAFSGGMAITGVPYVELLGRETPLFLHPGLLTISFLNLKNAALTPVGRHAPPKFARNYEKRKHVELVRYHTVHVDPSRTTKPTLPGAGTGREMPAHLVRGTLVTYADEDGKRLFGKYHGTFFRPPHVRGSAKAGISLHDYNVKAPKKAAAM
jgi:hypothetical protein